MTLRTLLIGLSLLLVAAPPAAAQTAAGDIERRRWELVSWNGTVPERKPDLMIEGDHLSGTTGCNRYSSSVAVGAGTIRVGDGFTTTKMFCGAYAKTEQAYLAALRAIERFSLVSGRLILEGKDIRLEFVAQAN